MGASLWDEVWLPVLLGLAIQLAVIFLVFLSVRLWNCFIRQLTPQTAGGQSIAEPELELGIVEGGEGLDYFSDQEAHSPVFESHVTIPEAQVTGGAARGALVQRVEMDVPHSQHEGAVE